MNYRCAMLSGSFTFASSFPSLLCIPALVLTAGEAVADTIEIRPLFSYTVSEPSQGTGPLTMVDGLFPDGLLPEVNDNDGTKARMEFRIPPEVLATLKTMEFRVNQEGVLPECSATVFLWYYPGLDAKSPYDVNLSREGFTAKSLGTGTVLSRNLLEGFNGTTTVAHREKLGLALDMGVYTGPADAVFHYSDPRLVITYHGRSANNGEEVTKLLTQTGGPFAGASDPALIGFEADPDHDGVPNFMEIWRGTRPDRADAIAAPTAAPAPTYGTSPGSNPGELLPWTSIRVSRENDDFLLVGAEASHDLVNWHDISASRKILNSGNYRYVTFTDSVPTAGVPVRYFRFLSLPGASKFE